MKILKKLFCKHIYQKTKKTFINDTDISGSYYWVLECIKCGKVSLGDIIPDKGKQCL